MQELTENATKLAPVQTEFLGVSPTEVAHNIGTGPS